MDSEGLDASFREVQSFRQPALWLLLALSCALVIGVSGYGLFQQLVLGRPWGDRPMSSEALLVSSLTSFALTFGLLRLFRTMALIVEVRRDAVHLHFRPFKRRVVLYRDILRVEACEYRPLLEYGGWGIRRGRSGWAYNVSGSRGVRLYLGDGKTLLVGSQRDLELAAAIAAALSGAAREAG